MKLTFLLIMVACLQVSARSYGQNKVTLDKKDAPIMDIIQEISRQTGYKYMMTDQWAEKFKPITVKMSNAPVEQVLDKCFEGQPYTYTIVNNTIVVKEKKPATVPEQAMPPGGRPTVTIKVMDDKRTPVVGAAVLVKGTNKTALTDDDGSSVLKDVSDAATVTISSIGYYDTSFVVGDRDVIYLKLRVKVSQLGEAVVSVSNGYQQIPRERAPGSFTFLNNELVNRRVSPDIMSRLEGVASGVLFTKNAASGTDISVRGRSTLFANAKPLIVVDNFPYDGDINNINPNDIENITILKDANAASIWGVQSGNGVIVLTTKKGRRNRPLQVEANTNLTVGEKPNLYYSRAYMTSSDFIDVEKSLFSQGYYDQKLTDPNHTVYSPVVQILADQKAGTISAAEANTRIEALKKNDIRGDISKYYYQQSIFQQYAVNVSGGSDRADYFLSAGFDQDRSNLVLNKTHRFTLNTNENFYLVKNLILSVGFLYTQVSSSNNNTLNDVKPSGSYGSMYPYASFADANGNHLSIAKRFSQAWVNDPTAMAGRLNWKYVPLDELGRMDNKSTMLDNKINLGLKYSFLRMFSVDLKYQYESTNSRTGNYFGDSSFYARDLYNSFYNPTGAVHTPVPAGGVYQSSMNTLASHRGRAQLGFNRIFGADHNVVAIVGSELSQVKGDLFSPNTFYGYSDKTKSFTMVDYLTYFTTYPSGQSQAIPNSPAMLETNNRLISYFGNASYSFKKRYVVSGSGRIDKSNLFGVSTNQKSVPLYSFGASWEVSQEKFYHSSWLPYLNLRATYGYSGNVNTSVSAVPTIGYVNSGYFFPIPYAQLVTTGNSLLRWERIRMINLAADFSSKNNRIAGSIEYYQKKGVDMFGNTPLAPSTGTPTFLGNTANIKGHGVDITVNATPIKTVKLVWNTTFLLSNEITTVSKYLQKATASSVLSGGADGLTISPIEGKPVFGIYSYRSGSLTHDKGDPQGYIGGKLSTDYASIVGNATPDSLVFNGAARPTVYGSWRNTFSYKGLSLSFNIVYKLNYYFRRTSIDYYGLFNSWSQNADFAKRWQKAGDESNTIVPSMPTVNSLNSTRDLFYFYSDKLVDKGDHIRLQDITVGYDFNIERWGRSQGVKTIKRLRVYSYVNNVGILWRANKDKLDPDAYSAGLPAPRSYAVGVQATF